MASDTVMMVGSKFELIRTGLVITGDPTYQEWRDAGTLLFTVDRATAWAIGDWWIAGEHRYGERARRALTAGGPSLKTCMNRGSVARAIEPSRRRDVLFFGHHEAVAVLPAVAAGQGERVAAALQLLAPVFCA